MSTQSIFSLKMSDINQSRMAESIVFMWKKLHLELRHFLKAIGGLLLTKAFDW